MIMDKLKPATNAYTVSAVAIPIPEKIPDFQFLFTVLWMHKIPSGPSGIDTAKPVTTPFHSKLKSIDAKIGENIIYTYNKPISAIFTEIIGYF